MSIENLRVLQDAVRNKKDLGVKNNTRNLVVVNHEGERLELAPVGTSGSIQSLPTKMAMLPGITRMVKQGKLVVDDIENMYDDMINAQDTFVAVPDQRAEFMDVDNVVVESSDDSKDLVMKKCLVTGENVVMTIEEVKAGVPPLVEHVKHMASQFVARQVATDEGASWEFDRVQLG